MNAFSLVSGVQFVLDVENVSIQFLGASKVCIEASFGDSGNGIIGLTCFPPFALLLLDDACPHT